jgi:hypothetical protein
MANALILNLPGGRLILGPADPEATHLTLKLDGVGNVFFGREVALSRQHALQLEQFIGLWMDPPLPLSDLEGEQRLLGALIRRPDLMPIVSGELAGPVFADPIHGRIWAAMDKLHREGITPDLVGLTRTFAETDALNEVGGPAYLNQLERAPPAGAAEVVLLARRISDMGIARCGDPTPPWEKAQ